MSVDAYLLLFFLPLPVSTSSKFLCTFSIFWYWCSFLASTWEGRYYSTGFKRSWAGNICFTSSTIPTLNLWLELNPTCFFLDRFLWRNIEGASVSPNVLATWPRCSSFIEKHSLTWQVAYDLTYDWKPGNSEIFRFTFWQWLSERDSCSWGRDLERCF